MLKIEKLSKIVGSKKIIKNIELEITTGLTFIVGDSGAGKSTLLNLIGGLDSPTEGDILLDFEDEKKSILECENLRRDYLGFIFQDANLINGLTVKENLELAAQISGKKELSLEIEETLKSFGILEVADEKIECVSGGERLRTAIARAVIKNAPILLADEPTGSLDLNNSTQVFEILKKLSKARIVIAVTHNLEMARLYGDRIITMCDGRVVEDEIIRKTPVGLMDYPVKNDCSNAISKKIINLLTFNNIRRFKAKFISIVLAIGVALSAVGIILSMNFSMGAKTAEMNTVYYDADMITFYSYAVGEKNLSSIIMGGTYGVIPNKMIMELSNYDFFSEIIPVCDVNYYVEGSEQNIDIKLINLDSFFENRLMLDDVVGAFPENSDQIILAQDLANQYFDGDAMGKNITISNDYGVSITYDIVGINGEKNVDGVYYTYISSESVSEMKFSELFACIYLADSIEDTTKMVYTEDASGFICSQTDGEIIYGQVPYGENQIAISTDAARDIYYSLTGEYIDFTFENVVNADDEMRSRLNEVLSSRYYMSSNDAYECSIVGVHSGLSYEVLASDMWAESITVALPNVVECYFNDIQTAAKFKESELASKFDYVSNYEERFENAVSTTGTWKFMFVIALFVVALLCVVLIHSYGKVAVEARLYETGILSSLGMQKREIKKVLAMEIYLLGLMAGVVGCFIYVLFNILEMAFMDYYISTISMLCTMFAMFAGDMLVCMLTAWYESTHATNMMAVDAIRLRE